MKVEQEFVNIFERTLWRGAGVVIALEAVKLIATSPLPNTESQALRMIAVGLSFPVWMMWATGRGNWLREDFSAVVNFLKRSKPTEFDPVERAFDEDSITASTPAEWTQPSDQPLKSLPYIHKTL